jgi:hypothetical protein
MCWGCTDWRKLGLKQHGLYSNHVWDAYIITVRLGLGDQIP